MVCTLAVELAAACSSQSLEGFIFAELKLPGVWLGCTGGRSVLSILFPLCLTANAGFSTCFIALAHVPWIRDNEQDETDNNGQKIGVEDSP